MGVKYQIIIEIDEEDNVSLETKGFKGPECETEIKRVTEEFAKVESTSRTKEFYEKAKETIRKKINRFSK